MVHATLAAIQAQLTGPKMVDAFRSQWNTDEGMRPPPCVHAHNTPRACTPNRSRGQAAYVLTPRGRRLGRVAGRGGGSMQQTVGRPNRDHGPRQQRGVRGLEHNTWPTQERSSPLPLRPASGRGRGEGEGSAAYMDARVSALEGLQWERGQGGKGCGHVHRGCFCCRGMRQQHSRLRTDTSLQRWLRTGVLKPQCSRWKAAYVRSRSGQKLGRAAGRGQ